MPLLDDLNSDINSVLSAAWQLRDGQVVPTTADVNLSGGGVRLEATMLYADLANSTGIAMWDKRVAARLFKAFLAICARIIRSHDGQIRSFDGDRVMAVFVGNTKNTSAMKCALKINYAVEKLLKPKFADKYEKFRDGTYKIGHCTGIDTSSVLVVRAGMRSSNDLVWVGRAPNVAAKLSALREPPFNSFVTGEAYDPALSAVKTSSDGRFMWEERVWRNGEVQRVFRSSWTWKP